MILDEPEHKGDNLNPFYECEATRSFSEMTREQLLPNESRPNHPLLVRPGRLPARALLLSTSPTLLSACLHIPTKSQKEILVGKHHLTFPPPAHFYSNFSKTSKHTLQ